MNQEYRHGKHSVTSLKSHLVFVTKYRKKIFEQERLEVLIQSFLEVAKKMDFSILEVNGEGDHVHLLVEYPPRYSVSQLVNHLKGVSSRMYRKQFTDSPHPEHLWSPSYFACSVGGAPIEVLKQYINNQKPS
ncbi:IS200/IS605 family transposase [Aulosira sp. FACHB-615]|uniref:IS200/IS605 family transposase n=1 Tax=Aulosira sp. FACHB-615 TaxID=2692777 RepID=UPI001688F77F|nr:IS200/IS605 family transposase [Aulosira sp. FACHB-615]MBD2488922.1 IS200/IS605 family transposase [Aulosira sp. FACHB-615]